MQCQADIQKLADVKFAEADCLVDNGFYDDAYYLGGYAIELLLKARVCKTLGIDDFFSFNKSQKETYRAYKAHDYEQLFLLSGIYTLFNAEKQDLNFREHWLTVKNWNEGMRYATGCSEAGAKIFLISVFEIMIWIKKHL